MIQKYKLFCSVIFILISGFVLSFNFWAFQKSQDAITEEALQVILSKKSRSLQGKLAPFINPHGSESPELIKNLAPEIWWHPDERFPASDPLEFIAHSELKSWHLYQSQVVIEKGQIDPQVLSQKYNHPILRPFERSGLEGGKKGYFLNYLGDLNPKSQSFPGAPLFWRISRHADISKFQEEDSESIILLVEYWYHSIYNPIHIYLGSHQGDWESFGFLIKIENQSEGLSYQVLKAYLSAHTKGEWIHLKQIEKNEQSRFVLYSSLGSHATYSFAGVGKHGILDDHMEKGFLWKSWEQLLPLQTQPYYGFSGGWGAAGIHWSMTGPLAPGPKYKYLPKSFE